MHHLRNLIYMYSISNYKHNSVSYIFIITNIFEVTKIINIKITSQINFINAK